MELIITTEEQLREIIQNTVRECFAGLKWPEPKQEPVYLSRKEVAKKLQVSLVTLSAWVKNGTIPAYKIGTRVRFKADEVERCLINDRAPGFYGTGEDAILRV